LSIFVNQKKNDSKSGNNFPQNDKFEKMSNAKISIRFFDDREVRALWDEENAKWWFSVLDIVAVLTNQNDYTK